jgi:hypothetical protein
MIVENGIMRLKRWAVAGSTFPHWHLVEDPDAKTPDFSFLERTMRVLCALTNWQVHIEDLRPLRGAGWSPQPSESYMAKLNTRAENELAAGRQEDYDRFIILRDVGEDSFVVDDFGDAYLHDAEDDPDFDAQTDGIACAHDDNDDDEPIDNDSDDDDSIVGEFAAAAAASPMAASSASRAAAYELRPRDAARLKRSYSDSWTE